MKSLVALALFIFLSNCSFDNKSGIWKNENISKKKNKNVFSEFETLNSSNKEFEKIIALNQNYRFNLPKKINNFEWKDIFYSKSNNLENFRYNNQNKKIFSSKKISRSKVNKNLLFERNNLIVSDLKGNIIVYSVNDNKIIRKFNFYKKNYKKLPKNLNIITENNIIYISDNFGYLYAFNYVLNKVIWAKNYKIPFRSNLKIHKDKLMLANQANTLFYINKTNGEIIKSLPTEETVIKNNFINNLALNEKNLFFINTYGTLYSLNNRNMGINWFLNLNQSSDLSPSNAFEGTQIVNANNKLIISSKDYLYILNENNGSIIFKKNIPSLIRPIVIENHLFIITKKNLLISLDLNTGKFIYSYNINQKIADFLNSKKQIISLKTFFMINGKIKIFLNNSYFLDFNINGSLENVDKLPSKIYSNPIVIDNSILYLSNNNKLFIVD
tara:strand:+ start:347 stop:1672 length:1326 start_codon:yes stop_codon:yes gene_type:complete